MSKNPILAYEDRKDPAILGTLEKYGVVVIPNFLKEQDFSNLSKETDSFIGQSIKGKNIKPDPKASFNSLRNGEKVTINKRIKKRDGDDGMIDVWNIEQQLNAKNKKVLASARRYVLWACENAFRTNYKYFTTNLYYNRSVSHTRGIHADSHLYPSPAKGFLYMSDITDVYDGPFSYILGSHKGLGRKYHRKHDINEPLDEDKDQYFIFDNLSKNDLVIACVSGAHRGLPQKVNRERVAYVHSFDPDGSSPPLKWKSRAFKP